MVVLTPAEEAKLLNDYSRIAWKLVHRFSDGRFSTIFSQEDLYQECMLVLIKHMKKCDEKYQLLRIQTMELVNAMTRFVLKNQVVKLDCNRTDQARRIIDSCAKRTRFDELVCIGEPIESSIDELLEEITLEQFFEKSNLRPIEKTAMLKKRDGYRVGEIAEMTGQSHQVVAYAVKSARKKYDEFVA